MADQSQKPDITSLHELDSLLSECLPENTRKLYSAGQSVHVNGYGYIKRGSGNPLKGAHTPTRLILTLGNGHNYTRYFIEWCDYNPDGLHEPYVSGNVTRDMVNRIRDSVHPRPVLV